MSPNIFDQILAEEEEEETPWKVKLPILKEKKNIFDQVLAEKETPWKARLPITKEKRNIFDEISLEEPTKKVTPPKQEPFIVDYYKWLHIPQEPAKSVYDWFTRVIPRSVSSTTVALTEFPYFAVKSVTDPLYEYAKDLIIRDKPAWEAAKERGVELGKGILDMAVGFGEFFGEPIGLYGWEKFKRKWLADPAAGVVALAPFAKAPGVKGGLKSTVDFAAKRTMLQKAYDWADIQARFTRSGAEKTGIAIKGFPTMKIAEQQRAFQAAKKLRKLKLEEGEGLAITFEAAEKTGKQSPKVTKAAKIVDSYYQEAFKRLKKDKVLKYPWPESMIMRNVDRASSLKETLSNTPLNKKARRVELEKKIKALDDVNTNLAKIDPQYVHIPLDQWFGKLYRELGKDEAQAVINSGFTSKFFKGRFFHQRKTIQIREMIDWLRTLEKDGKPIFTDLDFDARMIMASYAQKVGTIRGLAKIFNAAKTDGLLVPIAELRPKGYGQAPIEMRIRFPELTQYHVHNAFLDYLDGYLGKIDKSQQLGRIFGYTKMMAFYNPFFLPAYDLWQATWLGSVSPIHPLRTGKNLAKGFKSVFTKDKTYWEASETGTFSTPYSPPFENFMRDMQGTLEGKFAKRVLNRISKYHRLYPIVDDFYRVVWNMAWTGDHAIRMATYHHLKSKGHTAMEAGQTTAYFHADYARLSPEARPILNKIFFTPSFKYTMGHLQANMVKSSVEVMRNALKLKKPQARDLLLAKGAAALIAGLLAKDYLMKTWGFETDALGLRYVKRTETDEGLKEIVLYWPDPNNVILRQVHKWTKWGDDPDKLDAFMNKLHWDLHPLWQLSYELIKNIKPDGKHVFNPFDNEPDIGWDQLHHSVSRIMAVSGFVERYIGTEDAQSAYKVLRKDIGQVWEKFLSTTTLAYLRQPKEARGVWQIKKLQRLFNQFLFEDPPKTQGQAQNRIENYFKRLGEIQTEMMTIEEEKKGNIFDQIENE